MGQMVIDTDHSENDQRPPSPSSSTASSTHSSPARPTTALPTEGEEVLRAPECALAPDAAEHPYPGSEYPYPDLRRLKLATAARTLDPAKTVCKFEVPGGGLCRDARCGDAHISSFEPSDRDTAAYVSAVVPAAFRASTGLTRDRLCARLRDLRGLDGVRYDERVRRALEGFGYPPR
ncbi:hypothetical protein BD626DRAFT_261530 [Schizophyllum amplum]|uniref:Zinc-finger domain-containing protein n=1 Tax=Schizophyllum amplum TaxID=97359 RepID=A0A550CGB2_9AGAR|nr:hypothetical protein BD626DRAFT_261530 [Auriculariopsis ampla]